MTWSVKSVDFVTQLVGDLDHARAFYQDVLGLPAVYEDEDSAVFRFENTGINLLADPGGHIWEITQDLPR